MLVENREGSLFAMRSLVICVLILVLILSGCANGIISLHEKKTIEETDTVHGFYVSEDGDNILIRGEVYEYLFPLNESIEFLLYSEVRPHFTMHLSRFEMHRRGRLSGTFHIGIDKEHLDQDQMQALLNQGFQEQRRESGERLLFSQRVVGNIYQREQESLPGEIFSEPYEITLFREKDAVHPAIKYPLLPVELAAHGTVAVVVIAGMVFVFMPAYLFACGVDGC